MIFISNLSNEKFMYKLVVKYLKTVIEPHDLTLLDGLNDNINAEYGLKVFTDFEAMPVDLIKKINQTSVEELMIIFNLSFMQAKRAKLHIISGYPFSFVILFYIYIAFYPDNELLKHRALRSLFKRLDKIRC